MTSAHQRRLTICTFANERATDPIHVDDVSWAEVLAILANRQIRPSKSGLMLGGYNLAGPRANRNVPFRSLIQLDIDTQGVKDKATGRITEVTRAAPPLDQIRVAIDAYEWRTASSHWHEPQRGVFKYRITILPDRDILPVEYEPLLEALDERLGGVLDRDAWQWSRAFYLPSCPEENKSDAFAAHNPGQALPVDEFVRRGRDILEAKGVSPKVHDALSALDDTTLGALGNNTTRGAPPPIETMRAMLKHLMARDHFKTRKTWIEAGMALKVAYDDGADLWNETHEDDQARADVPGQWASFAAATLPGHVTIGTIIMAARNAGFVSAHSAQSTTTPSSTIAALRFIGNGGDVKNGQIFAGMFRNKLLHVHETDDWLRFDPQQGWVSAPPGEADRAAKEALDAMRASAADRYKVAPEDPKTKRLMAHVERSSKAQSLRAMIEMAKSEPGMTVQLSDFDSDPMLLGVANGVLNLGDWTMLPAAPDALVSKRCNVAYDPTAQCARFRQFLVEVQPEKEMHGFLRRLMGYCLTGAVDEQMFAFIYGLGANGKSVFIELAWMLGDYAHKISTEMLMHHQRNPQGPSPDIVSLRGRRFVYANETEEGGRLAEVRIKDLTGGDTLTGRVPYGKADITFRPTHKLFIVGTTSLKSPTIRLACGGVSHSHHLSRPFRRHRATPVC